MPLSSYPIAHIVSGIDPCRRFAMPSNGCPLSAHITLLSTIASRGYWESGWIQAIGFSTSSLVISDPDVSRTIVTTDTSTDPVMKEERENQGLATEVEFLWFFFFFFFSILFSFSLFLPPEAPSMSLFPMIRILMIDLPMSSSIPLLPFEFLSTDFGPFLLFDCKQSRPFS
ncbi:uncharacterized protein BO97DRAFT_192463 [Aspergillus homomorphus CBS 101889]|uniref:Uncharacterized protein n=1 Tax=Aspergillus homomorphus (strain CBS 101889) TaxID=1450537 RepID=A0A395HMP3_ASPHC|nr:hypothetical protein BO97DRAFT_192463 [Aspergillus homomorphus CBS 101889]RAL09030.1 hypothetical protein BO97DRAFT_192463 [Aspergillus homomorphus CBS 101889]